MNKIFNNPLLKIRRKNLRNVMPLAEIILWSKLKGRQTGFKFRRQESIGQFIVDFYCPEIKLAIELDGDTHYMGEKSRQKDEMREQIIESYGVKILRFTNNDIYSNLDEVVSIITHECVEAKIIK